MRRVLTTLLCCTIYFMVHAQFVGYEALLLNRTKSGHYAFHTMLNHQIPTSIMIESGISKALIDSAFLFTHVNQLQLKIRNNDMNKEINLGGTVYRISHIAEGTLQFGTAVYKGQILVLANYRDETEITIPIQQLTHTADWGSRIVLLDLTKGYLQMLTRKELRNDWASTNRYRINRRTYERMPALKTPITFNVGGKDIVIHGNFNLDLGNPMPLYLRSQSSIVTDMLNENPQLQLLVATDLQGNPVTKAFVADDCHIADKPIGRSTICILDQLRRFTTDGLIGLPFFMHQTAVFDFENNYLYLREHEEKDD